jgi:hypothetical protein
MVLKVNSRITLIDWRKYNVSFLIKCTNCGQEQEFRDSDSWDGENIELKPASWGGSLYLDLECKNPNCKEGISFKTA